MSVRHGFIEMTAGLIDPRGWIVDAVEAPVGRQRRQRPCVLLVEQSPSLARTYADHLKRASFDALRAGTAAAARDAIDRTSPQVVLLDLDLPGSQAAEIMRHAAGRPDPIGIVVLTSNGSVNAAVQAMQAGAHDYVVKPVSAARLTEAIQTTLDRLRPARRSSAVETERERYYGFIGSSAPMQAVYAAINNVAASKATVFITGESGTGKEIFADAVHRRSARREKPFVAINCGAIPRELMESEIFGHVKGAFTGAVSDRPGAAGMADRGTLFLDEVCELDAALQAKLLRFLQSGTFRRVGGSRLEQVDVRIICATNRDPVREVAEGRFRQDLYYRLHVLPVHLPPLRDRGQDVGEIAQHFLVQYAREENRAFQRFAADARAALEGYDWPGNVRELQNVIRHVVVLNDGIEATAAMLPPLGRGGGLSAAVTMLGERLSDGVDGCEAIRPLRLVEKDAIETAIAACDGNVSKAAALLEISASTIYRKKQAWASGRNH